MKKHHVIMVLCLLVALSGANAFAFDSGSACKTPSDPKCLGAFSPTTDTEVTLPADGILNYATVNIPAGVAVTFKKNASNTPVYILASGDVTIAGTISVNGSDANGAYPGKGGPGGSDGGFGGPYGSNGGRGLGLGGGGNGVGSTSISNNSSGGGGGGFGATGANGGGNATNAPPGVGGAFYGNNKLLPMIGGSGGGGGAGSTYSAYLNTGGAGGGGGGAILIASSGTLTISGAVNAKGGNGGKSSSVGHYAGCGGGGSGGAIKLAATAIAGAGTVSATGGTAGSNTGGSAGGAGGNGRVRIEADTFTYTGTILPATYTFGYPGPLFPSGIPALAIAAVGSVSVPASPAGKFGQIDVTLPAGTTNPVTVSVTGTNVPVGTQVTVTSVPEYGASTSGNGLLSGTLASSTASVAVTLSTSYQCILTATATFTVQTAMYYDGEKIDQVRVAAAMGGESSTVYITEKGREIPAAQLMAKLMME